MSDVIKCCDPFKQHILKPAVVTRKTKSNFRAITELMRASVPALPENGVICNPCRHLLSKQSRPSTGAGILEPGPSSRSNRSETTTANKFVFCADPLFSHPSPKRKGGSDSWYRIAGKLLEKANELQIEKRITPNALICFECKHKIYLEHSKQNYPGVYCADPSRSHKQPLKKKFLMVFKRVTREHVMMASTVSQILQDDDFLCWGCDKKLRKEFIEHQPQFQPESQGMEEVNMEVEVDGSELMEIEDPELTDSESSNDDEQSSSSDSDEDFANTETAEDTFDKLCKLLNIEYNCKSDLKTKASCMDMQTKIQGRVRTLLKAFLSNDVDYVRTVEKGCTGCISLVESLINAHTKAETLAEKYKCMTSTPRWVTVNKLSTKFNVSRRVAVKVSKLRKSKGAMSGPLPRIGRRLPTETVELVKAFYRSDDNSRFSPGARDTIFIRRKIAGKTQKQLVQKREILCTMKQLYKEFCQQFPYNKISMSKFASLRPKECIWGFKNGFQKSCMCIYHTNFSLLCDAIEIKGKTSEKLSLFFCSPDEKCMLGLCENCPKLEVVETRVQEWEAEVIEYWSWESKPGSPNIELMKIPARKDKFLDHFRTSLSQIAEHHFIFLKQQEYINRLKEMNGFDSSVGVLNVDFGQNYSFVVPDAIQSYHWNNKQATVHPFCFYYRSPDDGQVKLFSFIVISDTLKHDATTFHVFRNKVLEILKERFPFIKEIKYISDGCSSQYKNFRNFVNLVFHIQDFGLIASWIFSATSHGKDVVDAMSALAKRLTRLESLRRKDNFIVDANSMHDFLHTQNTDQNKLYIYVSDEEIMDFKKSHKLEERYSLFRTVPGTRKYHYFAAVGQDVLECRYYATSAQKYVHRFSSRSSQAIIPEELTLQLGQYASFVQSGLVFYGMVTEIRRELGEVDLQIMKKVKSKFIWPDSTRIQTFSSLDFVCKLTAPSAMTSSCRHYQFSQSELNTVATTAERMTHMRILM